MSPKHQTTRFPIEDLGEYCPPKNVGNGTFYLVTLPEPKAVDRQTTLIGFRYDYDNRQPPTILWQCMSLLLQHFKLSTYLSWNACIHKSIALIFCSGRRWQWWRRKLLAPPSSWFLSTKHLPSLYSKDQHQQVVVDNKSTPVVMRCIPWTCSATNAELFVCWATHVIIRNFADPHCYYYHRPYNGSLLGWLAGWLALCSLPSN